MARSSFIIIGALAFLGACTSAQVNDPTTVFSGVVATFGAAVSSESIYLASGKASPAIVAQIEKYRIAADGVLHPIETEIAAGQVPSSTEILAAQVVVNSLTQYMASKGIATNGSN